MTSQPEIRAARPGDAADIAGIINTLGWFPDHPPVSEAEVAGGLAQSAQDPARSLLVADSGGQVLGYAAMVFTPYLFLRGTEAYLAELFVSPLARGRGVGALLLRAAEDQAKARGCFRLSLITSRDRDCYQRDFYGKQGWRERPVIANFILPLEPVQGG